MCQKIQNFVLHPFSSFKVIFTRKQKKHKIRLKEFEGSDRTRQMQVLNLRREFEILMMKEKDTVTEYANKLMKVVN